MINVYIIVLSLKKLLSGKFGIGKSDCSFLLDLEYANLNMKGYKFSLFILRSY